MIYPVTVSDDGLADAPAIDNPPNDQRAPLLVSRDGQVGVRICDAGGFPEGTRRYTERAKFAVPPNALVAQKLLRQQPCQLNELIAWVNGTDNTNYYYLQLHDTDAVLTSGIGTVPVLEFPLIQKKGSLSLGVVWDFDVGLVVALSTVQGVYTNAGTNQLWFAAKTLY